jgi:putative heme-binding domain-containing protein
VGNEGGRVGPDLTRVGTIRSGRDLMESVVFPSSTFAQGFEPYVVTLKDKQQLSGLLVERDEGGMTIRDSAGAETRVAANRIASVRRETISIMPEGLDAAMTEEQLRDLLAYLQSLR